MCLNYIQNEKENTFSLHKFSAFSSLYQMLYKYMGREKTRYILQSWTYGKYAKYGQKVHFLERAKSAYFLSATSDRDNE